MTLAEKLVKATDSQNEIIDKISNEICGDFRNYIREGELDTWIEKRLNTKTKLQRSIAGEMQYWPYCAGCSDTNFGILGYKWYNPDPHSYDYLGVKLGDIAEIILKNLYAELCAYAEINDLHVAKNLQATRVSHTYEITITW